MEPIWIVSMVLQWLVIAGLTVVVVALVRQLGVLTVRLNPAAGYELDEGPSPGTAFPARALNTLAGEEIVVGDYGALPTVMVFVAPGCGPCESLAPAFGVVNTDYAPKAARLVVAVNADERTAIAYAKEHALRDVDVVAVSRLAKEMEISSTPYAVAIGSNGIVAKRGVVNAMEHLEEMMEIAILGVTWPSTTGAPDARTGEVDNGNGLAVSGSRPSRQPTGEVSSLTSRRVGPGGVLMSSDRLVRNAGVKMSQRFTRRSILGRTQLPSRASVPQARG